MPSPQKVHLDRVLTNLSLGYKNEMYIGDEILPAINVDKQSDRYYTFGMESFRVHDDARAPGTVSKEINWTLSHDSYYVEGHALRSRIADEEKQNADSDFNLEADATALIDEGILLNKEIAQASTIMNPANYHADLVVTAGGAGFEKWSDLTNSNPLLQLSAMAQAIHKKSAVAPNTLVMSYAVFNKLIFNKNLIALLSNSERQMLDLPILKQLLGIDRILVGRALKSTNNPGQVAPGGIEPLNYIWGESVALLHVSPRPAKKSISFGYTFMWNKDGNGPVQTRKWYDNDTRSTVIESERWYACKSISNVAGFLLQSVL